MQSSLTTWGEPPSAPPSTGLGGWGAFPGHSPSSRLEPRVRPRVVATVA